MFLRITKLWIYDQLMEYLKFKQLLTTGTKFSAVKLGKIIPKIVHSVPYLQPDNLGKNQIRRIFSNSIKLVQLKQQNVFWIFETFRRNFNIRKKIL